MKNYGLEDPRLKILKKLKTQIQRRERLDEGNYDDLLPEYNPKVEESDSEKEIRTFFSAKIDAYLESYNWVAGEDLIEEPDQDLKEEVEKMLAKHRENIMDRIESDMRNLRRKRDKYMKEIKKIERKRNHTRDDKKDAHLMKKQKEIQGSIDDINEDFKELRQKKEEVRNRYYDPNL